METSFLPFSKSLVAHLDALKDSGGAGGGDLHQHLFRSEIHLADLAVSDGPPLHRGISAYFL